MLFSTTRLHVDSYPDKGTTRNKLLISLHTKLKYLRSLWITSFFDCHTKAGCTATTAVVSTTTWRTTGTVIFGGGRKVKRWLLLLRFCNGSL
mmetsp:Transcript_23355/g.30913  ORF Transcript_23355/g.30913 Transcript_23355/m.30913 type:complete len:92 (+) Transcript_23355:53-328(+)